MKILVNDTAQAADLIAYLRAAGCIAYRSDDSLAVESLGPPGVRDVDFHVRELVSLWEAAVPGRCAICE